ncbi:MAG TPA: cysteine desulfurase family protein [Luteolibacter sp.]|nr:cysteine desulfurase family protein [Luteolibacter sp.]
MIDLDANASTRLLPEVLEAMLPWLADGHANPSASYRAAKTARAAIDLARQQVADLIGAHPEEILFTGGGTESVNTALHSLDRACGPGVALASSIEHSAVLRCLESLSRPHRLIPVERDGRIDPNQARPLLDGAAFVSVMAANNETGVIQPLRELIELAHALRLPVHSDAIQAIGKMPFDVVEFPAELISISAHKFHGPKGVGALYIRRGIAFHALLHGGGQEAGRRSGTENTAAIVGMGMAAELAKQALASGQAQRLATLRDHFEAKVMTGIEGVRANGNAAHRLPNTCHLSFEGCDAAGLLILLDQAQIQCSAGSACMTGKQKPSHVQLAMGIDERTAKSSLRFSFSRFNADADASHAADAVIQSVRKLRSVQGPGVGPVSVYGG